MAKNNKIFDKSEVESRFTGEGKYSGLSIPQDFTGDESSFIDSLSPELLKELDMISIIANKQILAKSAWSSFGNTSGAAPTTTTTTTTTAAVITHDELNVNIGGPSALFQTHDLSFTPGSGKNEGKFSVSLDSKEIASSVSRFNEYFGFVSTSNDLVVEVITFNNFNNALNFKSNYTTTSPSSLTGVLDDIQYWGVSLDPNTVAGNSGYTLSTLQPTSNVLANSAYGPNDMDKIMIAVFERDVNTGNVVQYFEKWFAFELVGPEAYPQGWV